MGKGDPPASFPEGNVWRGTCPFTTGDLVESRSWIGGYRDAWWLCKVLAVKKVPGPASYELTLDCVDFEDEPFQCELYQGNPGLLKSERELMVRPVAPRFHRQRSVKQGSPPAETSCQLRRSYQVGDAVEYLLNSAWWSGRVSEVVGETASVWWRPPPFGEGGEDRNIRFEALRPTMIWDHGEWSFPGHPDGPLGVLLGRPAVTGRQVRLQALTDGTTQTEKVSPGKRKAKKKQNSPRKKLRSPKVEASGVAKDLRRADIENSHEASKAPPKVPFSPEIVNKNLTAEQRKEIARKALEEDARCPNIDRLKEAMEKVLGCEAWTGKKGRQFLEQKWRKQLARCAKTGRPYGIPQPTAQLRRERAKSAETEQKAPFSVGKVNETLSKEQRMEIARKALEEDGRCPDLARLKQAVETVIGCKAPTGRKGPHLRGLKWRRMLARCAQTGGAHLPAEPKEKPKVAVKVAKAPFSGDRVNESLTVDQRMEVARKALENDAICPDLRRLKEAIETVMSCEAPLGLSGSQFREPSWRKILERCAKTGRAYPPGTAMSSINEAKLTESTLEGADAGKQQQPGALIEKERTASAANAHDKDLLSSEGVPLEEAPISLTARKLQPRRISTCGPGNADLRKALGLEEVVGIEATGPVFKGSLDGLNAQEKPSSEQARAAERSPLPDFQLTGAMRSCSPGKGDDILSLWDLAEVGFLDPLEPA